MIQKTSLDSYMEVLPELNNLQQIVYDKLFMNPDKSNRELSKLLGWDINRVTPRIKELRELNMVVCNGIKYDKFTNRNVMFWKVR